VVCTGWVNHAGIPLGGSGSKTKEKSSQGIKQEKAGSKKTQRGKKGREESGLLKVKWQKVGIKKQNSLTKIRVENFWWGFFVKRPKSPSFLFGGRNGSVGQGYEGLGGDKKSKRGKRLLSEKQRAEVTGPWGGFGKNGRHGRSETERHEPREVGRVGGVGRKKKTNGFPVSSRNSRNAGSEGGGSGCCSRMYQKGNTETAKDPKKSYQGLKIRKQQMNARPTTFRGGGGRQEGGKNDKIASGGGWHPKKL